LFEGSAAAAYVFIGDDAESRGEAAQGIGDAGPEGGDVVEGDDPVTAGDADEVANGARSDGERGGAGLEQSAEESRHEGLAGAGGALKMSMG